MNIPKIMESERKKKNISQTALARMTGINRRTIAAWERGEHGMTIENADKVFKALEISVAIGKE